MKKTLLSVKELAVELGISELSVRRAYIKGGIPGERICRMLRFDLDRVRRAMRRNGLTKGVRAGAVRVGDSRPRGRRPRGEAPVLVTRGQHGGANTNRGVRSKIEFGRQIHELACGNMLA